MAIKYVNQEVKDSLKKEHGDKLRSLILPMDDDANEEIEVLAVVPSRSVTGYFMKFLQSDPKKGQEILVKNCIVTDKELILADDGLFYAAAGLLTELIPVRQGKFGKV
ncbi:hypothetical protein CAPN002_23670 [Capnocytophaga stomatis]|uniref:hypothetical protein n=1 Tax=Capnocytophaga stomatis TaxID=1848904 RepID=UPI00194E8F6A|nr:hypothetical protein [Capnocytophaga stomatis]GIJ95149.1 hypothetical protein CAPN002_23670 [Capnocytophaga stomatis]